jgi:hypothetical protein
MVYLREFKGWKACFYCYVCSMGDEQLHLEFMKKGSKECRNPNAIVQLGFGVYHDVKLHRAAMGEFGKTRMIVGRRSIRGIQGLDDMRR